MKLARQEAKILLSEEGVAVLEFAGVPLARANLLIVEIEESEDLGLWLSIPEPDGQTHYFLLMWHYVLGIDIPSGLGKITGLKG